MKRKEHQPSDRSLPLHLVGFLVLIYLAHWSGQALQIGGTQLAPSIPMYTLMALSLAPRLNWPPLVGLAVVIGALTIIATSSPYPVANLPAHGLAFLFVAYLVKANLVKMDAGGMRLAAMVSATTLISWTLFAVTTWLGPAGTELAEEVWTRFGIEFGSGFGAWFLFGLVGVAIPTAVLGSIVLAAVSVAFRSYVQRGRRGSI